MRNVVLRAAALLIAAALPLPAQVTIVEGGTLSALIRNLYGGDGITLDASVGHDAHFGDTLDFQQFSEVLQRTLQSRSFAPVPSAAGVFSYSFNEQTGTYERIDATLGPIVGERAGTSGKGNVNLAFGYSVSDFQRVDGRDEIDLTLRHCMTFECVGENPDHPLFQDVIKIRMRMRLKTQTLTTSLIYGLRDNLDVGIVVPFLRNDLSVFTDAAVVMAPGSLPGVHRFNLNVETPGQMGSAHATGIGDMVLRAKYKMDRFPFDFALLGDATVPTGDKENFLGTGAFRLRGTMIASSTGERFSPHLNAGFEINTENVDLSSFEYRLGSEWAATSRLTLAGDLLGTVRPSIGEEFIARALETQSLVGDSEIDLALGGRYRIRENAVFLFNYLVPVNDAGIRPETSVTFGLQMALQ